MQAAFYDALHFATCNEDIREARGIERAIGLEEVVRAAILKEEEETETDGDDRKDG